MPIRAFIAYDFAIVQGTTFANVLEHARESQPFGQLDIRYADAPDDPREQGTIWRSLVQKEIQQADKVLAFIDLPNANVGFEIGYALGCGKPVAIYRFKPTEHAWLQEPPLRGLFRHRLQSAPDIHDAFLKDSFMPLPDAPEAGDKVLLLCPPGPNGAAFMGKVDTGWHWLPPPSAAWNIESLPEQLAGVGLVVWVILPHGEEEEERDGGANAALSLLAGYAEARPDLQLRVLIHEQARQVADVAHVATPFNRNAEFRIALEQIQAEWQQTLAQRTAAKTPPSDVAPPPAALLPCRPGSLPAHPDDLFKMSAERFVGRESQLALGADAVRGLMQRFASGSPGAADHSVTDTQLIWAHGFGGMGKSWLLHQIRCQAESAHPAICSLIVDWDKPEWLAPLAGEPRTAEHLFHLLAVRLSQRLGVQAADTYWLAEARVRAAAAEHQTQMTRFEAQLDLAQSPGGRADSRLRQLLGADGSWHDDDGRRGRLIETLRGDPLRYRQLFVAWCGELGITQGAITCPHRERADGLRQALAAAAARHPLILVLDTCEVLSDDLDTWLRELLAPLLRERRALLVLMGSRLRPDIHQTTARRGWREELPAALLRLEEFGSSLRFTVQDIEQALGRLDGVAPAHTAELAERLHAVTLGVPLAVSGLLDLHRAGDEVLQGLAAPDDDLPLGESEAVRQVIGMVSRRLLLNLVDRPDREDDLRDLVALTLLPAADLDVLDRLWRPRPPRERLRELTRRYSLFADGDLHLEVRRYLRRFWRADDERPACFQRVLQRLRACVDDEPAGPPASGSAAPLQQAAALLNLRAWDEGDAVVPELARLLCLGRAHEGDTQLLEALLTELPLVGPQHAGARRLWHRDGEGGVDEQALAAWLRDEQARSQAWSNDEKAALDLLQGLAAVKFGAPSEALLSALRLLNHAIAHFGEAQLPRKAQVGLALSQIGARLLRRLIGDTKLDALAAPAVGALEQAIRLDPGIELAHYCLGELYQHQADRPEEAEQAYLRALDLAPGDAYTHTGLGNLYQYQLNRTQDAEQAYLRAIELDPKHANPHLGLGVMYLNSCHWEAASTHFNRANLVDNKKGGGYRGLGWVALLRVGDVEAARAHSDEAQRLEPNHPGNGLLQVALQGWVAADDGAVPGWAAWVQGYRPCDAWLFWPSRHRIAALLKRFQYHGQLPAAAQALRDNALLPGWQPWCAALDALLAGQPADSLADPKARELYELLKS